MNAIFSTGLKRLYEGWCLVLRIFLRALGCLSAGVPGFRVCVESGSPVERSPKSRSVVLKTQLEISGISLGFRAYRLCYLNSGEHHRFKDLHGKEFRISKPPRRRSPTVHVGYVCLKVGGLGTECRAFVGLLGVFKGFFFLRVWASGFRVDRLGQFGNQIKEVTNRYTQNRRILNKKRAHN